MIKRFDRLSAAVAAGLVSLVGTAAFAAPISVAVLSGSSGSTSASETAAQLNDDSYFDFTASVIAGSSVTSQATLAAYDVVVLGGSGYSNAEYASATLDAVRAFMTSGRGVVTAGWYRYGSIATAGQGATDADFITPVLTGGSYDVSFNGAVTINSVLHPITSGVGSIGPETYVETGTLDMGATALGTAAGNGQTAIAYQDTTGRSVYLGLLYMANAAGYGNGGLRTGNADRLFEQAVAWAATAPSDVPEPGSLALAGLAMAGLAAASRQRKA